MLNWCVCVCVVVICEVLWHDDVALEIDSWLFCCLVVTVHILLSTDVCSRLHLSRYLYWIYKEQIDGK